MKVLLNGQPRELREGCTLAELLQGEPHPAGGTVATAVNGEFVPRVSRDAHVLNDGDAITCFQPITGG